MDYFIKQKIENRIEKFKAYLASGVFADYKYHFILDFNGKRTEIVSKVPIDQLKKTLHSAIKSNEVFVDLMVCITRDEGEDVSFYMESLNVNVIYSIYDDSKFKGVVPMVESMLEASEIELKKNEDKPNDFDTFTRGRWE
ncbi:MAG: hypothetical protein J6Y28_01735 [Acholeplasmatales bacterium]|nr:hypothetical protein [Acholeplasmatales bacterium]